MRHSASITSSRSTSSRWEIAWSSRSGSGIGSTSGVSVEIEVTHVYEVRDNLIARVDEYGTLEAALKAAGLSE